MSILIDGAVVLRNKAFTYLVYYILLVLKTLHYFPVRYIMDTKVFSKKVIFLKKTALRTKARPWVLPKPSFVLDFCPILLCPIKIYN